MSNLVIVTMNIESFFYFSFIALSFICMFLLLFFFFWKIKKKKTQNKIHSGLALRRLCDSASPIVKKVLNYLIK